MKSRIATFMVMLLFWVVLSGMFDGFHLGLGLLCCLLVAWFGHNLLFFGGGPGDWVRGMFGVLLYLPWLFWQIVVANFQVAYIALHPRSRELLQPRLIRFRTRLKRPISRVTFAQSITLTPGTITVTIDDDEFTVYALTRSSAEALPGEMERRVAAALEPGP